MALLEVHSVRVEIPTPAGRLVAVDDVSFEVSAGEAVAIVGESGAGKTTLANALINHPRPPAELAAGRVVFDGAVVAGAVNGRPASVRGSRIGYVVTNPSSHLDPLRRIGDQVAAAYRLNRGSRRRLARRQALEALRGLNIPDADRLVRAFPHQISGGMAQRVVIAIALAREPELLIADEPVSGLDVTLQRQILNEITDQARRRNAAMILVTHDLGLAAAYCNRVIVMYAGQVVEDAAADEFFDQPRHPYSVQLVAAVSGAKLAVTNLLSTSRFSGRRHGCPYAPACPAVFDRCRVEMPALRAVESRRVRCHLSDEAFHERFG